MSLSLSLNLAAARRVGSASVALDNATILEKTGALGLVGTLTGVSGTPILSDSAGGRFILMGGQIRCGGVATNYSGATSHSISVIDNSGTTTLTITVTQAGTTGTAAGGSIFFQRRNGVVGTRYYTAGLISNFFGDGTTRADGVMLMRVQVPRGNLGLTSADTDFTQYQSIVGTIPKTNPRGIQVRYAGPEASAAQAIANRFVFYGLDQGGRDLGNYADNDVDGSPSGFGTTGARSLRSAVITDADPRLLVLTYEAATTTFRVFTYKMDGTQETGDVAVNAGWTGITASPGGSNLTIGSNNGGSANYQNYFSGCISDLLIGTVAPSTATLTKIAKGANPYTEIGGANVQRYWPLDDISGTGLVSQGTQGSQTFVATNTGARSSIRGPMLCGAFDGTDGIATIPLGDGYTEGLAYTAATGVIAATATCKVKVIIHGASCNVEARVRRQVDGAVLANWHTIGTSVSGTTTLTTNAVPSNFDLAIDVRRADKTSLVASNNERHRVGVKIWHEGQSQVDRWSRSGTATLSAATTPTVSFSNQRGIVSRIAPVDIGLVDNNVDLGDGMMALAERVNTLAPNLPLHICIAGISSTSIQQWVDNAEIANSVTYPIWGDYTTVGSGFVTDMMLASGKDLTFYSSHRGTSDVDNPNAAAYPDWLRSIYLGTGPRASTKSYAGFSGATPHVLMHALARDVDPANNPYSAGWLAHHLKYNDLRANQAQWSPPAGLTTTFSSWFSDVMLQDSTQGPHESITDPRGYITEGYRLALGFLKACGLTNFTYPSISGVVRTSGTVLTVSFTLPNGGSLKPRVAGVAPNGIFEVSEDSGTTWRGQEPTPPFTAAYSGNTITLTKAGSWAAAGLLRVRFAYGGPYSYGVTTSRATQYANENVDLDGYPFESYTNAAPSDGSGYIQGLPIQPTLSNLTVT